MNKLFAINNMITLNNIEGATAIDLRKLPASYVAYLKIELLVLNGYRAMLRGEQIVPAAVVVEYHPNVMYVHGGVAVSTIDGCEAYFNDEYGTDGMNDYIVKDNFAIRSHQGRATIVFNLATDESLEGCIKSSSIDQIVFRFDGKIHSGCADCAQILTRANLPWAVEYGW